MTDKATLLALAERVEAATGPDRELGREVLRACGWKQSTHGHFLGPLTGWTSPDRAIYFDDDDFVRGRHDPTASLDAALTLVPEGYVVGSLKKRTRYEIVEAKNNSVDLSEQAWSAWVHKDTNDRTFRVGLRFSHHGAATTRALALCAAAIRARAAQAIEAGRAETTGSACESAVGETDASDAALLTDIFDKMAEVVAPLPGAHRQSAIAELCEGLREARGALIAHADMCCEGWCGSDPKACETIGSDNCGGCPARLSAHRAEAILSKHSPDAPGQHAGTRAIEPSEGAGK